MEDNSKQLKGKIVVDTSGLKSEADIAVKQFDKIRKSIDAIPMSLGKMDASFAKMEGLKKDMGKTFSVDPSQMKGIREYWEANAMGAKKFKDAIKGGGVAPFANAIAKANINARQLANALSPLIQKTLIYQQAVAPEKYKRFDNVLKLIQKDLQVSAEKTRTLATAQKLTQVKTQQLTEKFKKQDRAMKGNTKSLETYRRKMRDFGNASIMTGRQINRFFTAPIVAGGVLAVKGAIQVEAGVKKLDVIFSHFASKAERQVKSFAKQFGLAPQTVRESMAMMGDMVIGFGMAQEKAFEVVKGLTVKAADLGAFQPDMDFTELARKFARAFTGETESLKPAGISVLQNDPEFKATVKRYMELEGYAQNLARSMAIYDQIIKQTYQSVDFLKDHWDILPIVVARTIQKVKELKNLVGKKLIIDLELGDILKKIPEYIDNITVKIKDLKKEDIVGYFNTFKKIAGTGIVLTGTGYMAKFAANTTIAIAGISMLGKKIKALTVASKVFKAVKVATSMKAALAGFASLGMTIAVSTGLVGLWKIGDVMVDSAHKAALLREAMKPLPEIVGKVSEKMSDWVDIREKLGNMKTLEDVFAVSSAMKAFAESKEWQKFDAESLKRYMEEFKDYYILVEDTMNALKEQAIIRAKLDKIGKDNLAKGNNMSIVQDFAYDNMFSQEERYQKLIENRISLLDEYYSIDDPSSRGDALKAVLDNAKQLLSLKEEAERDSKTQEAKIITNANVAYSSQIGTSKALEDMYKTTQYEPVKVQEKMAGYLGNIEKIVRDTLREIQLNEKKREIEVADEPSIPSSYLDTFDIVPG